MGKAILVGARFDPDERAALRKLADKEQRSMSTMTRILVLEALQARDALAPPKPKRRAK